MAMRPKQHSTTVRARNVYEENVRRTPVSHARTRRHDDVAVVTSGFGGKFVPLKMVPLLREDRALSSTISVNFQMAETADMLINPVRATAVAYLVPKLAFERFQDLGTLNRSYNGQQEIDGSTVPWFDAFETTGVDPEDVWAKLGLHVPADNIINTDYIEAYNAVWNYIAAQRSPNLTLRSNTDPTLAPAFWESTVMKHVKATFDDAMMEGTVPLEFIGGSDRLTVYSTASGNPPNGNRSVAQSGTPQDMPDGSKMWEDVWAELQADSVQVSLANIDLARETAAWARLRTEYQGLDEDWMMDQLLSGVALPEEGMKHPILIDHAETIFGMQERYATDGANLETSVADGRASLTLNIRTPQVNTGGVIVIAAQCLPEQTYERRRDHYAVAATVDDLPNRTADELDPQPVDIVTNAEVDERHSLPSDVFGYEPLNAKWIRTHVNMGGKYYRPNPGAPYDEDRNRIWDTDVTDPQLGPDFYLSTTLNHDVFKSKNSDPFEFWCGGRVNIEGLTYFGPALRESSGDYEKVLGQVDRSRIEPPAPSQASDD